MRFIRDTRGQAVVVEYVVMFFLLIGFLGGFSTYALASHARAAVVQAADAGGRLLAIECNPSDPNYPNAYTDATNLAVTTLQDAGLKLGSTPAAPGTAGSYSVATACSSGNATLTVTYEQRDVFPVLGHVLFAGPDNTLGTFELQSGVVFAIE